MPRSLPRAALALLAALATTSAAAAQEPLDVRYRVDAARLVGSPGTELEFAL